MINVSQMENNDQFVRHKNVMRRPRGLMLGGRRRPTSTQPPGHSHSSARMQGSISSTTCHVVYAFLMTTLISLLQLKYQNKKVSPFETHLTPIRTFVATMCIYSLAMAGKITAKNYRAKCCEIFSHVSILSGALSSVSLAMIFLPTSLSSLITFIVWAIFSAFVAIYLFHTIYNWLYPKIAVAIVQVQELLTSFMGQLSTEPPHSPVARIQGSISSKSCHVVYAFLITTLIGLLQVKYQNKNVSPFETHLTSIRSFVISMSTYCLAMVGKTIAQNYGANCSKIFGHVGLISGALSSASLAVLFLQSSLSSLIVFIMWAILVAIMVGCLYKPIYQWLYRKIATAVVRVVELYASFTGQRLIEHQRLPV